MQDVQVIGASDPKGLTFKRHFTTKGTHPFDQVEWETRDAVIPNFKEGGNAFEQRGVEFPLDWSQNATNIVAQKYFRGPLGAPERESSVRQLVSRVVDTIRGWGEKNRYFSTEQDAQVFADELTHLLVDQKAAFNSPVWFNVGVPDTPQQCSACQPYGALVSTPDGLIPIGKLVEENLIGAKVHDASGVTSIVATKANGVKEVLRVHTKSGHQLEVTGDHLVWRTQGIGAGGFVPAAELRAGDKLQWHRRESFGDGEIDLAEVAEAALVGWLQSDGSVAQDEGTGSPTIEAITVNEDEHAWVSEALDRVFPTVPRHERIQVTYDEGLECRRIRLDGNVLEPFVERWGLRARGADMEVPERFFTAPLPVVAAYLRSIFQAEGYVRVHESSGLVAFEMTSERLVRGVQQLLARFGVFARVSFKRDPRFTQKGCWQLSIGNVGDQVLFEAEIGFVDARKTDKLDMAIDRQGMATRDTKRLEIGWIEPLGPMEVYDIQTESGEYLSGNLRVHNCFILAVEDHMSSILNWYVEEGTIFKGGSGSGINLSKIRSSKEGLAGGGTASGPVSFMRGADASAGTIKSGGKTRRAAKMVILNVDHPDVRDFIWCKAVEERKARVLRDAGFDMDLDGKDSHSTQYQNANNSVRVSDEFMRAFEQDQDWKLKAVLSGETVESTRARDLMRDIAQAAWECADPGMQYDTTINEWHTCPASGRINGSNPCSEYMHLDNSACNLASLNLMKFVNDDGTFDVADFKHAVEIVFTAQEILVGESSYPTEKIGTNARAYRQLGLGYANLGALLMARGLAYDSDAGRAWAGAITALMTGHAYRTSAIIAEAMDPFEGYESNADAMLRVMRKHREAAEDIDGELVPEGLLSAAKSSWDEAVSLGERHGYRNAQASVLAPTGTIGLMMDCDTTGIEPELALVKTKKLVGGGTMQFVNRTVPRALERLGYDAAEVDDIVAYIAEHNQVTDAPHLKPEHRSVFDTAMGDASIHYMGHVRMMGAAQPFISGAISKTVNMPEHVTVEEVEQLFVESWKLGLKAVAIYRDNCKVAQPMSADKKKTAVAPDGDGAGETQTLPWSAKKRLPRSRPAITTSFRVGDAEGYITAGSYPDDGLGEIFLKASKQGSTLSGIMDAFSIAVSVGLQYGVPLEDYASKFINMKFEPSGMTDDADIRFASSIVDFVFRRLALDHLPPEKREALGIRSIEERKIEAAEKMATPEEALEETTPVEEAPIRVSEGAVVRPIELISSPTAKELDAPLCYQCGSKMQPAGSCYVCGTCGSTSGCS
ncbi:MAG: vitamin B12-dependent ribonucleotide reductase [Actinobacteria bacterium]|nr:vitamin B12-dependent ribonucleotide reductase [Actinomycetota bacterium]